MYIVDPIHGIFIVPDEDKINVVHSLIIGETNEIGWDG